MRRMARKYTLSSRLWGGATPTLAVPVTVGACRDLATASAMTQAIVALGATGATDAASAQQLTQRGYRSSKSLQGLPSTVKSVRLRHGIMPQRQQSPPRQLAGYVTEPQRARTLQVSPHWLHDRLHNGRIQLSQDRTTGLSLFPDHPTTIPQLQPLRAGTRAQVCFGTLGDKSHTASREAKHDDRARVGVAPLLFSRILWLSLSSSRVEDENHHNDKRSML